MEERLIEIFKEYLPAWSWEEWQAAGASDKEDIVINALADLGPDMPIEVDEAYDLFWDWAAGITEADFSRKITESTTEDPYGYGPYKTFSDPDLEVGNYVLTTRPFSAGGRTYPARITSITPKWIEYEISGFGFTDRGTKARPGSANDKALRNARTYIQNMGEACDESLTEAAQKQYKITYREDGVSKSFTVLASSKAEAEQKAWSQVDADSVWVTELEEELTEANKVIRGVANKPWYSGGFRGLNDIDTRVTDAERERVARENEERRAKQAELEAERRARAKEKNKQLAIQRAEDAIAKGVIDEYNEANMTSILSNHGRDIYPAIDPETKELVFDMAEKKRILDPIVQRIEAEKEAKKAAEKEAAKKAAERREAEKPITYYLYPEVVINGETMRDPEGTRVVGQDNLIKAAKEVAREELKWVNTEHKFYVAGGHAFNWDGVITIICENPDGTEEPFRTFRVRTNENLEEAVRVVSDPDVLYHATEVGPFYDILNSGVMLHDVRNEGGVHAICFTTDDNYAIHGYPCKIKFSRSKLEQGGYELYPVDEFEDDDYGESEERCDEDINDVRKYVTEVIIDWEFIAVMQDGDDCRLSTGEYDEEGNESDNWDLKLSDFQALLDSLKASGIKVTEKGQPEADDEYWFDETGEFKYGREPAFV